MNECISMPFIMAFRAEKASANGWRFITPKDRIQHLMDKRLMKFMMKEEKTRHIVLVSRATPFETRTIKQF